MRSTDLLADPERLLSRVEVAAVLGVSVRTLNHWRATGQPAPRRLRLSHRVSRYRARDVLEFLAEREDDRPSPRRTA